VQLKDKTKDSSLNFLKGVFQRLKLDQTWTSRIHRGTPCCTCVWT